MLNLATLSEDQIALCRDTISSYAFYMLVGDALDAHKALSVVRMGDGEHLLMKQCQSADPNAIALPPKDLDDQWMERLGCKGITNGELVTRLRLAAELCSHFAPSITGIQRENFNLYNFFRTRDRYVDNFFVNQWTEEMKIALFKKAQHVLFIHRNVATADAMQIRAKGGLGVKVTYLKLSNWNESEGVIEKATKIDAPLVLFSAGPASKYIGPMISMGEHIPKVTIDIGNAADYWTLSSLRHIQRA
jgi:glycosyltransferase GT-like protein